MRKLGPTNPESAQVIQLGNGNAGIELHNLLSSLLSLSLPHFFLKFIYFFILREREHVSKHAQVGWGAKREGDRESQVGSSPSTQSPMWGSNSRTMRSWLELKSRVRRVINWATQEPLLLPLLNSIYTWPYVFMCVINQSYFTCWFKFGFICLCSSWQMKQTLKRAFWFLSLPLNFNFTIAHPVGQKSHLKTWLQAINLQTKSIGFKIFSVGQLGH